MKIGFFLLALILYPAGESLAEESVLWPLGPEVQVNPEHPLYQEGADVGLALDGSAVVLWTGDQHLAKRARWMNREGLPIGEQVTVNPPPDIGFTTETGGAFNAAGKGVTCWQAGACYCRQLDTFGSLGAEAFRCSDTELEFYIEREPKAAVFDDGSFVVVWRLSFGSNTIPIRDAIQARFFDAAGHPTSPIIDLLGNVLEEGGISVAALAGRRAVVAWRSPSFDGSGYGIRGQVIDATGSLLGEPFLVNTYVSGDQEQVAVASDRGERFVATWRSDGQDGSAGGIYAQRFDAQGAKIGGEIQVSSDAPTNQSWPAVTMDRLGNFVVSFYSFMEAPNLAQDTFLRAFRVDGTPRGPQVRANEQILHQQQNASIALSDAGLVQVAYESWRRTNEDPDYNWDIMTRRFVFACEPDAHTLCLGANGRFQVRAFWRTSAGQEGAGSPLPLTTDTGGFYFFSPGNFELLVKVLDACGVDGHYWIFAAGLTDVEVELIVTDTFTGEVEVFENRLGQAFAPVQRLDGLAGCGAQPPGGAGLAGKAPAGAAVAAQPTSTCAADPAVLCFRGGRFRVTATWRDFLGQTGRATAFPVSEESGLFYFFTPSNLELAVKVLDGCTINDRFWVFAVGLTNVAVELEVEDTVTGEIWRRSTGLGEKFPPFLDSGAFATCGSTPP